MLLVGENSPTTLPPPLFPFCFSFLGERWVETGVPGLLRVMDPPRGGPGESTAEGLGPVTARDLFSAGLFRVRGEGRDRFDVVLLGEPGLVGLGTATGTLADRVA